MAKNKNPAWLAAALDYIAQWQSFQVERYKQPGCAVAIANGPTLAAELAFGAADLSTGQPLTPRHRFRIASHSKTFTAAGVMLLREQDRIGLDDAVGHYVPGLHKGLAKARISELMSHGGGVTRDGADSGQFADRKPFLSKDELMAELAVKQPLAPGLQMKYSNHGFALLGLVIEQVTGQPYAEWMMQNVVRPAGLDETVPDMPWLPQGTPLARGHSAEFPFGTRLVIPGDNDCNAIAPAGGFVSTAADVARFFAQLDPGAGKSILSPASRREMMHRHRRDSGSNIEQHYGFGTMIGAPGPKEWFGHTGSLQGFVSRTARFTASGLTVTVLCNANDGASYPWVDSLISILTAFRQHGAPGKREAAWAGRWWNLWGASDLVPMGKVVCQVVPALNPPFDGNNTEITVTGKDHGVVSKTSAYNHPGEGVRRVRDGKGLPAELWIGSSRWVPKDAMLAEVVPRYAKAKVKAPAAIKPKASTALKPKAYTAIKPKAPSRRAPPR